MRKFFDIFISTFFFVLFITAVVLLILYSSNINLRIEDFITIIIVYMVFQFFFGIYVMSIPRYTAAKLSWVLVVTGIPIFGIFLYFIYGRPYRDRKSMKKWKISHKDYLLNEVTTFTNEQNHAVHPAFKEHSDVFKLVYRLTNVPFYQTNELEMFRTGNATFDAVINEIKKAKKFIHMEYFIIKNDSCYEILRDTLIEKVKQGVEVRIIGDWFGTSLNIKKKNIKKDLLKNGIQYHPFHPFTFPFFDTTNNCRLHRKIIVIDNLVGFIGGNNIGLEYTNRESHFGVFTDVHLKVRGEVLRSMHNVFLSDWEYLTHKKLILNKKYSSYPEISKLPNFNDQKNIVQIITQGPDLNESNMNIVLVKLITSAKKRVWITTPYFVPTDALFTALIAAKSGGVDVKIMVPAFPDNKRFVWHLNQSFYNRLVRHGIEVHEYQSFIHTKMMVIDDEVCMIGTCNFDLRSLYQSYEAQLLIHGSFAKQAQDLFKNYLENSKQMQYDKKTNKLIWRIYIALLKVISPIF